MQAPNPKYELFKNNGIWDAKISESWLYTEYIRRERVAFAWGWFVGFIMSMVITGVFL